MVVSEHRNNLYKCAHEFRNLCLQRSAIKMFKQFRVVQKQSIEQKASIRMFYHANLKVKLIRFLHESNIEFI